MRSLISVSVAASLLLNTVATVAGSGFAGAPSLPVSGCQTINDQALQMGLVLGFHEVPRVAVKIRQALSPLKVAIEGMPAQPVQFFPFGKHFQADLHRILPVVIAAILFKENPFLHSTSLVLSNQADLVTFVLWGLPVGVVGVLIRRWKAAVQERQAKGLGSKRKKELDQWVDVRRRQIVLGGAVSVVVAALGQFLRLPIDPSRGTAPLPAVPFQKRMVQPAIDGIPESMTGDTELVRARILTALEKWNYFDAEIQKIALAFGYSTEDLRTAVRDFTDFMRLARVSSEPEGSAILSVMQTWLTSRDEQAKIFSYRPDQINELLKSPWVFFHEAMHFLPGQQTGSRKWDLLLQDLNDFVLAHLDNDKMKTATLAGGRQLFIGEVIEKGLWDTSALSSRPEIQTKMAKLFQPHWQVEIEAFYFQIAFCAAQLGSSDPHALD